MRPGDGGSKRDPGFGLADLLRTIYSGIALLAVPAWMLSFLPELLRDHAELPVSLTLAYVVGGVVWATLAGRLIERRIRILYTADALHGLAYVAEDLSGFSLQVVSRDLTTVFERISWYAQDIGWISSLLGLSALALGLGFGIGGLAIAAMLLSALWLLYRACVDELVQTRMATIAGFDALIDAAWFVGAIAQARATVFRWDHAWLDQSLKKAVNGGIAYFFDTRLRAVVIRSAAVGLCSVIIQATLFVLVLAAYWSPIGVVPFIFAVSALLLIQSDLSNAFLALTGLKSQSISVDRVVQFASDHGHVPVTSNNKHMQVGAVSVDTRYAAHVLQAGGCYSLVAPSGAGKTRYLKIIAGVSRPTAEVAITETKRPDAPTHSAVRCYYLNQFAFQTLFGRLDDVGDTTTCLRHVLQWVDETTNADVPALILLDEALSQFSEHDVHMLYASLDKRLASTNSVLVAVDHRVSFLRCLRLTDIRRRLD